MRLPYYRTTKTCHKAKNLYYHLRKSHSESNKVTAAQCRKFIARSEERLMTGEHEFEQDENINQSQTVGQGSSQQLDVSMVEGLEGAAIMDVGEDEEEDEDDDWLPGGKRFKGRTKKEWKLERMLARSDQELFETEEMEESENVVSLLKASVKLRKRREQYSKSVCDAKTNEELFVTPVALNKHIKDTKVFKDRLMTFLDDEKSKDILFDEAETPEFVVDSEEYRKRLSHWSRKDKSGEIAVQEAKETIKILGQTPGKEAREQMKLVGASVTSLRYGVPDLGLNWREEKVVYDMKRRLVTGEDKVLRVPEKAARQVLPAAVAEVAAKYWQQTTTPEPAKHRRLTTVVMDGSEAVPTRYQTSTDKEAYDGFMAMCGDEAKSVMQIYSQEQIEKYSKRPESVDKQVRLKHAKSLADKLPSFSWFLAQRPQEVKMMHDHTTGLCKVGDILSTIFISFFFTDV